jgi:hypothetical protein
MHILPINPHKVDVKVYVLEKQEALKVAQTKDESLILCMHRSRLQYTRVRCSVVWQQNEEKWAVEQHNWVKNKEVFNIEVYTMKGAYG